MPPKDHKAQAMAIATELKHRFKARKPKFTPEWSRDWVLPDNVLLPKETKVQLKVNSSFPGNRDKADIVVRKAWNEKKMPNFSPPALELKANKVVVAADGKVPAHKFTRTIPKPSPGAVRGHGIWNRYDKLNYHFECRIDNTTKRTAKTIKVKRWHVQALDNSDDDPNNAKNIYQKYRKTEGSNFINAYKNSKDDKAHKWEFNANTTTFAQFCEKMKNTYAFVYTGHGAVMCRKCHRMFDNFGFARAPNRLGKAAQGDYRTDAERRAGIPKPAVTGAGTPAASFTDAEFGKWTTCSKVGCKGRPRSTHCIGGWQAAGTPSFLDATHIASAETTPNTPKYLMFSVCCGGAFDTSLYDAYIGRSTKYCIGFEKSTRCDWARDYAKSFFDTWVKTHKCNPDKIPDVFNDLQSTWQTKLQPSIFGRFWGIGSKTRNLVRRVFKDF